MDGLEQSTRLNKKGWSLFRKAIRVVFIVSILFMFLVPVVFIVGASFKTQREFYLTNPSVFPRSSYRGETQFSTTITAQGKEGEGKKGIWFNYVSIFSRAGGRLKKGIIDSLIISIISTILTLLFAVPAAYSLARYRPGGDQISFFILSILFLPPIVGVMPLFFIFKTLGLLDTYLVLFVSYLFINLPFATWIMQGFFKDVPQELEQAALVDGYSRFKTFIKVSIPLAKGGIAISGLFAFIFSWNELLFASMFTRRTVQTLPLVIQDYVGSTGNPWGELFAAGTISLIPAAILALTMQKYIIRGLSLGEVKME